jgi:outer membrane protein TolC
VFGLVLPQSVLPSMSGPVLGTNDLTSVWGSAVGVLVSWEPFDFGLRRAHMETAESAGKRAEAGVNVTRLEVATGAADACLTLLAAQQTVVAARAGVDRATVLAQVVEGLAKAGLRPGADAARTRAELARARTQVIQAEQSVAVARASLAQFLALPASQLDMQAGPLLELPPDAPNTAASTADHPLAREQTAAVQEAKAAEHALTRSYFPRFNLQASSYARGTGARTDGSTGGALSGFGPNIQNWALGLTVSFPAFDLPSIRARRQVELHRELAEAAQYDRVLQDLDGQREKARAQLEGARRVAENTPVQLQAAREAEAQSAARYKTGLGNIVEVADAQRLLTQAETEDALAKLSVWRGLLASAAAAGDLQPFLQLAGK